MVEHEIDPAARRQGGQLLEQFEGLEEELPGPVRPGRLEREQHAAVAVSGRGAGKGKARWPERSGERKGQMAGNGREWAFRQPGRAVIAPSMKRRPRVKRKRLTP